jgi:hypothetical protein
MNSHPNKTFSNYFEECIIYATTYQTLDSGVGYLEDLVVLTQSIRQRSSLFREGCRASGENGVVAAKEKDFVLLQSNRSNECT